MRAAASFSFVMIRVPSVLARSVKAEAHEGTRVGNVYTDRGGSARHGRERPVISPLMRSG